MLTKEDLEAISGIIETKVPPIVEKVFDEKINDPRGVFNVKLDAVQEQLDGIDTRLTNVGNKVTNIERQAARTDGKLNALVNVMEKKRIITENEKRTIQI